MVCSLRTCTVEDIGLPDGRCRNQTCRRRRLDPATVLGLPLFDGLEPAAVMRLLGSAAMERHPPRTMLFGAGEPADAFFILLSGRVKLFALMPDGRESIVEIVQPPANFAEAAMFASGRYPVNAETIEDADLIRVRAAPFLGVLRTDPHVARRMLGSLCGWNRHLRRELRDQRHQSPIHRLACYLLSLAGAADDAAVLALPLKKAVLASRLGMQPETLSRVLARMRDLGVRSEGRTVWIDRVAALRAFCAVGDPEEAPAAGEPAPVS